MKSLPEIICDVIGHDTDNKYRGCGLTSVCKRCSYEPPFLLYAEERLMASLNLVGTKDFGEPCISCRRIAAERAIERGVASKWPK